MKIYDIQEFIQKKQAVLIYFYNDICAPCKVLRPKIKQLVENEFPEMEFVLINAGLQQEIAAAFGVFASPTILVFFESKEYFRESKNISISELNEKIYRVYSMIF